MDIGKIMVLLIFIILIIFFISNIYNNESLDMSMVNDIKYICNEIGSRPAGSLQEQNVALYIQSRFNDYGVSNEIQEFRYYSINKSIKKSRNIIGTINGISKKQIIICADLDTYGNKAKDSYTQGANDDTATLAILMRLAEHYKNKKLYYTIKLIGFGAGEDEYTTPIITGHNSNLTHDQYNNIINIPYLVGARHYILQNNDATDNTIAVISLEALAIGDPYFISQDSFVENNPLFIEFLVKNTLYNGYFVDKIDFLTYKLNNKNAPISHIYLPFSYADIPSTFLTSMKNANLRSMTHNNQEIPNYLTINDTYENLIKNNGNKKELQNHLNNILNILTTNIDNLSQYTKLEPINKQISDTYLFKLP